MAAFEAAVAKLDWSAKVEQLGEGSLFVVAEVADQSP